MLIRGKFKVLGKLGVKFPVRTKVTEAILILVYLLLESLFGKVSLNRFEANSFHNPKLYQCL